MNGCRMALALATLGCLTAASPSAAETFAPDDDGYIRDWLVLAPIPLAPGQSGVDGLHRRGLPNEGQITPKESETVTVADKKYVWKKCPSTESYLDFNEFLGGQYDDCVAYAVCYLWVTKETRNLKLKMGSDDEAKVWLNGKEVLKCEQPRALLKDQDTATNITLTKGRNVIVFKVVNEKADFAGSLRFVRGNDQPFRSFTITLAPAK